MCGSAHSDRGAPTRAVHLGSFYVQLRSGWTIASARLACPASLRAETNSRKRRADGSADASPHKAALRPRGGAAVFAAWPSCILGSATSVR